MAGMNLETIDFDNPEELARAFNELENGSGEQAAPQPKEEQPKADSEASKTQQEADKGQQTEPEPEGVATKDGKHIIPYSVLKSERERAARSEQIAAEMRERVEKLEAMVQQQASQGAKQGESARTTDLPTESEISQEDLEDLKENFPTVYKAVMGMQAKAQHLESKLQPVEETVKTQAEEQARSNAEAVQDAIDAVPKLAHIQANDPAAFELAKQFDATLIASTVWADKPMSERFAKVAEMVEAAMGPIELPGSSKPPSQEEIRKAAEAKAAQAAKSAKSVPTSLSEFPAGQHAAQDEREAAEQLTPVQLAEKFARMTPEQMDAYFQEL